MKQLHIKYLNWLKFSIILSSSLVFWTIFPPAIHADDNTSGDPRVTPRVGQAKVKMVQNTKKTRPRAKKKNNRRARRNQTGQSLRVTERHTVETKVGPSSMGVAQATPQEPTDQPAKTVVPPPVPQTPGSPDTPALSPTPPATNSSPQNDTEEAKPDPVEAKVGVFVTSLYGFDLRNQSYNVTFWAWFIHNSKDYKPENTTEIINAHSYNRSNATTIPKGKVNWSAVKFSAKVAHHWNISNFPFDHQTLRLVLEDAELDDSALKYIADVHGSKVDTNVILEDWDIIDFNIKAGQGIYQTTYGDPELIDGNSTFSRVTMSIILARKGERLFFSMFSALYIAFILTTVAFFVPLENISARLSLATASIFAAIGNKYVVDSMLPPSTALTLVDKLQMATFLFIGIMVLVTVIYAHFGGKQEIITKKINKYGEFVFPLSYILLNVYWVYSAT